MNTLQFTKEDKQAIRKNQQEMVNLLGTNCLSQAYVELADGGDYDKLIGIAPIFKKMNDILEDDDEASDEELDRISEIDEEITDFLDTLPVLPITLDFDTFYERFNNNDDDYFSDFTENYTFSDLFNVLLETKQLTKAEKEKIITIITGELQ
jgi:hypothetical protein